MSSPVFFSLLSGALLLQSPTAAPPSPEGTATTVTQADPQAGARVGPQAGPQAESNAPPVTPNSDPAGAPPPQPAGAPAGGAPIETPSAAAAVGTAPPPKEAGTAPPPGEAPAAPQATAPAPAKEDEAKKKLVAVLDLKVDKQAQSLANALATVLATDIASRPGLRAISRNELKSLLANNADASLLGCDTANCASDVARLVDAQLVLSGTLGFVPSADANGTRPLILTLTLMEPSTSTMVARTDVSWRGPGEELITAIRPALDRIFDGPAAASYVGAVEIFAPAGTTVALDGKELGTAPLRAAVRDLAIGVHTIDVTGPGYVPAQVDVAVSRNETSVVRVVLEEEPYYTRWWFWTAVGAGAAVAVAAGTVLGLQFLEEPPTRIVVKAPLPSPSAVSP